MPRQHCGKRGCACGAHVGEWNETSGRGVILVSINTPEIYARISVIKEVELKAPGKGSSRRLGVQTLWGPAARYGKTQLLGWGRQVGPAEDSNGQGYEGGSPLNLRKKNRPSPPAKIMKESRLSGDKSSLNRGEKGEQGDDLEPKIGTPSQWGFWITSG